MRPVLRAGLLIAASLLIAGCGGDDTKGAGELRWDRPPRVLKSPTLAADRLVHGNVTNDSLQKVVLKASDVKLLDRSGGQVQSSVIFSDGYSHRLAPLDRRNEVEPENLQVQRGLRLSLQPGDSAPLTVAWRVKTSQDPPVRVDYGAGSLPLP